MKTTQVLNAGYGGRRWNLRVFKIVINFRLLLPFLKRGLH